MREAEAYCDASSLRGFRCLEDPLYARLRRLHPKKSPRKLPTPHRPYRNVETLTLTVAMGEEDEMRPILLHLSSVASEGSHGSAELQVEETYRHEHRTASWAWFVMSTSDSKGVYFPVLSLRPACCSAQQDRTAKHCPPVGAHAYRACPVNAPCRRFGSGARSPRLLRRANSLPSPSRTAASGSSEF